MAPDTDLLPGVPLVESPLFEASLNSLDLTDTERDIAARLNRFGYAVLDFPDPDIHHRIERIMANLGPLYRLDLASADSIKTEGDHRIQDAWKFNPDVRAIAANPRILDLLEKLYGRRAFPFQTLNFPVGTQQHMHTDSVHFSSQPERFMCGVWVAFEDVTIEAGPLFYYPGSHRWPIISNLMIGRKGPSSDGSSAQAPFEAVWRALVEANHTQGEAFLARKGQALIWAANLLHGGMEQFDKTRTRWSQVTHYFFADCLYYTPAFSEEALGQINLRTITDIGTGEIVPNQYLGEKIAPIPARTASKKKLWRESFGRRGRRIEDSDLPTGFDAELYYRLNPDVESGGMDAATHYLRYGRHEGRRFR